MAYSRWTNSIWYSFWVYSEKKYKFPTEELKNNELFEICDFPSYYVNYGTIKHKGMEQILKEIKEFYSKEHKGQIFDGYSNNTFNYKETTFNPKNPTDEEIEELRGYLNKFVNDVDEHYKWSKFFYDEWLMHF